MPALFLWLFFLAHIRGLGPLKYLSRCLAEVQKHFLVDIAARRAVHKATSFKLLNKTRTAAEIDMVAAQWCQCSQGGFKAIVVVPQRRFNMDAFIDEPGNL